MTQLATKSELHIRHLYPQMGNRAAILFVALTTSLLTFSGLGGVYAILLLYALWVPKFKYKGRLTLRFTKDVSLYYILIGLCLASLLWSDYRSVTLRSGLEFASMILCAIVIARIVSLKAFVYGLSLGSFCVLLTTFMTGSFSLEGLFSSKNQAGFVAEIGIFCSIFGFFMASRLSKPFFSLCFIFCCACLAFSHSATSTGTLVVALAMAGFAHLATKLPVRMQMLVLTAAAIGIFFLAIIAVSFDLQSAVFGLFGKDATLTGRTYLWGEGYKIGMEAPLFGHGYNAFWVIGQPKAERYWYEFGIYGRNGFHFHNLFVEVFVELGIVGMGLIALMFIVMMFKSFRQVIKFKTLDSIFLFSLSGMMLTRAFTEVDFFQQYGIGHILFFGILPRLAGHKAKLSSGIPERAA